MNFLRLSDQSLSVLFEDEDIIAIDKSYGFNAHTNDSKMEHSDFIEDGLIEMYEKQLGRKLHIIHRLDQTTTGVMIFGKSVESAKKYAEYFFNRQVQKTYWFITAHKSYQDSYHIDQQIIHKAKELDANTDLSFVKRSERFELWEAKPHTGRNHQIRIHAKAAGIPILGDSKYGGQPYPFLCLHNCRIEFPNGLTLSSRPPAYFENLNLLNESMLARVYFEADRRKRLFAKANENQSFRLGHIESEFTLEQMGEKVVLNWFKERWSENDANKFKVFAESLNKKLIAHVYTETGLLNWTASEGDLQYEIRSENGKVDGLILNQRLQRGWILNNSKDKSVLNLFARSGTASVAAAAGGASQVTVVESSKKYLEWAKVNFSLNHLQSEAYKFFFRDSVTYIEQCQNKNTTFDLIICDVPAFLRREKGVFKIENDLEKLIKSCLQCLNPKGQLLISTSFEGLFIDDIRRLLLKIQKNLEINCILPALDFELPGEKIILKSFLIQKN